jgi:hypothetical protein
VERTLRIPSSIAKPHITLHGTLPAESAVRGAFVRIAALRSLALGQEGYRPHSLQVVEVVPRAQDDLIHRLDLAIRTAAPDAGDVPAPEWEALLRQCGFAGREDLETYLLDHGISRRLASEAVAEAAPDSLSVVASAMMIVIASVLQAYPAASGSLSACTPILRALIRSAPSADVGAALVEAAEALFDRAPRGLWIIAARPVESLFGRLRGLTLDLQALSGAAVDAAVVAPGPDGEPGPADRPAATIRRLAAALPVTRTEGGTPGVLVATDAAAWTRDILTARIAQGSPPPVRIGLHTGLRGSVDLCLPRHARCWVRAGAGRIPFCGTLEAITLLIRALRIARDARLREVRGPSGPIVPRTGSA